MANLILLNGPNLNLLGSREPDTYGTTNLKQIEQNCIAIAKAAGHQLTCFQSNAEHLLIEKVHQAAEDQIVFGIINPGALAHTSVALRDAFKAVELPFIEVHVSNVHARESFRHHSFLSDIAIGVITGLGPRGYEFALQAALENISPH